MEIESLIESAAGSGASDLHLEAGMPAAVRVRGALRVQGEPIAPKLLLEAARNLIGENQWPVFLERRSFDLSKTIRGVRCRINVLQTSRGVGLAIRLLSSFQATVEKLNLHPDLKKLVKNTHGLILICGPTGSGKSSTLAALIQEINLTETRHIVTVESPIEYTFRPRRAYIRQREVGRDTPSFEQALLDALREDPDVLMVGEMRDPETMRLTLSASETGHLVLATVHSSSCAEALQRVAAAFPAEIQSAVCAQLSDCLVAAVSQRLRFRQDLNIAVPECEILMATHAVKNFVRIRFRARGIPPTSRPSKPAPTTACGPSSAMPNGWKPGPISSSPARARNRPTANRPNPFPPPRGRPSPSRQKRKRKPKPRTRPKAGGSKSNRSRVNSGRSSRPRNRNPMDRCQKFVCVGGALAASFLMGVFLTGCTTQSQAEVQAQSAYIAGQRDAFASLAARQRNSVTVIGPVQNSEVTWTNDLTLSQAIITANYTGSDNPRQIILTRQGQTTRIDPQDLLQGQDVPLQPGDIVTLQQ